MTESKINLLASLRRPTHISRFAFATLAPPFWYLQMLPELLTIVDRC